MLTQPTNVLYSITTRWSVIIPCFIKLRFILAPVCHSTISTVSLQTCTLLYDTIFVQRSTIFFNILFYLLSVISLLQYQEGGFKILDLSLQSTMLTEINGEWKLCPINFTDCNIANIQVRCAVRDLLHIS